MTRCLAYEFGPKNITVNCIAPGGIKTDMYGKFLNIIRHLSHSIFI